MPVGIGGGVSLGSYTIFIFTDATAMSRGLRSAERDVATTQKRISATIAAGNKLSAAKGSLKTAIDTRDIKASNDFVQAQRNVALAATATAKTIDEAYRARSKAVGQHLATEQRAAAREKDLESQREKAAQKAAALELKRKDLIARFNKGESLQKSEIAKIRTVAKAQQDLANIESRIARQRSANAGTIAASAKRTGAIIAQENAKEKASIASLKTAIDAETDQYLRLARQAGPAYARFATQVRSNAKSIILAEQEVARNSRNLALAQRDRLRFTDTNQPGASEAKNREEAAVRALEASQQKRERIYSRRKNIETQLTAAINKEAVKREARVKLEAERVQAATEAENRARRDAVDNTIQRASTVATIATVALGAAVKTVVGQFGSFEEAMIKAAAISPELDRNLAAATETIQDMAVELGKSPTELAEALNEVAQAGFEGEKALEITLQAAKAAAAGYTTATAAAKPFIGVLNAYKDAGLTAADVSDKLFSAVTEGVFSFEDLSSQLGDNLSIYSALGISLDELLASYVALTKRSNNLSESTTQLNAIANAFLKPSQGLQKALKAMGFESAQAVITTKDFGEVLAIVEQLLKDNAGAAGELFPNIRSLRGIFGLTANEVEEYNQQLIRLKGSSDGVGATQRVLAREQEALMFQFRQTTEAVRAAAISLGSDLATPMLLTFRAVSFLALGFRDLDRQLHGIFGLALGGALAFGVMSIAIVRTVQLVRFMKSDVVKLRAELAKLASQFIKTAAAQKIFAALANPFALAATAIAAAGVFLFFSHRKHEKAVKELKAAYEALDKEIEKFGNRPDLTVEESDALEKVREDINATIADMETYSDRLSEAMAGADLMLPPTEAMIAVLKELGKEAITTSEGVSIIQDELAKLGEVDAKAVQEALTTIFATEGLDVDFAVASIRDLLKAFKETGDFDPFISGLQDMAGDTTQLTVEFRNAANAQVKLGKTLVNTEQFFGNAEDAADTLRQGLKAMSDQALTAAGVLPNLNDPLAFMQSQVGGVGETASQTLRRMEELGKVSFDDPVSDAIRVTAAIDDWQDKIDDVNASLTASDGVISIWQERVSRTTELVGSAEDGFAGLQDMLDRGRISQSEYNDILEATTYLQNQAVIAIDNERVAQAKALPDLAAFVQQHELAVGAYENLDPAARGFAEAMKDTTNQAIILTVVMLKLAAAINPDAFNESFLNEFIRQIAVANPEVAALLDTMHLIPDEVKSEIQLDINTGSLVATQKKIDDVQGQIRATESLISAVLQTGGNASLPGMDTLEKRLELLQRKEYEIKMELDTSTTDAELAELDENLTDIGLGADKFTEQWQNAFGSVAKSAAQLSDEAANVAKDVLQNIGAVSDLSDPFTFLNKQIGEDNKSINELIVDLNRLGKLPIKLSIDQQEALDASIAIKKTEAALVKLDEQVVQNESDMTMWQSRIDLVDKTIGTSEDTMAQYEAQLASGQITQEEFNAAVADGSAHRAYAELNQLVETGRLTQKEADDAREAGIFIRQRSVGGILDERAAQALLLKDLATLIQLHDEQDRGYQALTGDQKLFLAGLEQEAVQTALNTVLMFAQLEAMGVLAKGTTAEFVDAVSSGNELVGAYFDEIKLHAEDINITVPVGVEQKEGQTAGDVVDDIKETLNPAIPVVEVGVSAKNDANEQVEDQTFQVHADTSPADTTIKAFKGTVAVDATETGLIFDGSLAESLFGNAGFIGTAVRSSFSTALNNSYPQIRLYGQYAGFQFDYGVAQGVYAKGPFVQQAVRWLAGLMNNQLLRSLLIRSPSKKGAFAGSMFIQGVINEIVRRGRDAVSATRRVADEMSAAMSDGLTMTTPIAAMAAGSSMGPTRSGFGKPVARGSFVGPSTNNADNSVFVGNVDIDVNGASGDAKEISQEVWREFHGGLRRLNKQVG